jgi:hypothetical protein
VQATLHRSRACACICPKFANLLKNVHEAAVTNLLMDGPCLGSPRSIDNLSLIRLHPFRCQIACRSLLFKWIYLGISLQCKSSIISHVTLVFSKPVESCITSTFSNTSLRIISMTRAGLSPPTSLYSTANHCKQKKLIKNSKYNKTPMQ